jgi:hypothetical protein
MPQEPSPQPASGPEIEARLHEVARALREARHLDPEAQEALADLVDELGKALDPAEADAATRSQVAESAAQLARALRKPHDASLLAKARDRFEEAAVRAETEAPLVTGILRRLIDALSNIGI